ncbi:hypothetical protein EZS27_029514, partial [termite gut metagenome]
DLKKEIQEAFEDKEKRETFYSNIASVLENYKSHIANKEKATQALLRIAKAFGLDWNNLINLSFNKNSKNKYYAEISEEEDLYMITMNKESIIVKDTMRKLLKD